MKWAFVALILIVAGLALGSPFLDFLAPNEKIWLVDLTNEKDIKLLANGAKTLWYQWQIWLYIALFILLIVTIGSLISEFIKSFVDQQLSEKKQDLNKQIAELKWSKSEFEKKMTQKIQKELAWERNSIEIMTQDALDKEQRATVALTRAERINKATNHSLNAQDRKNHSKLSQRDRLSGQKIIIVEYLDKVEWKIPDGSRLTYAKLLELAKNYHNNSK
ncbi:hypothetical protein [Psychromonas aquatilis]|uniref:Uncharacterized protein n=1 Tax=Psychromonas aquatilis TaxID=2005072 RepID=A0ABU9GTS0_9GAMM